MKVKIATILSQLITQEATNKAYFNKELPEVKL